MSKCLFVVFLLRFTCVLGVPEGEDVSIFSTESGRRSVASGANGSGCVQCSSDDVKYWAMLAVAAAKRESSERALATLEEAMQRNDLGEPTQG